MQVEPTDRALTPEEEELERFCKEYCLDPSVLENRGNTASFELLTPTSKPGVYLMHSTSTLKGRYRRNLFLIENGICYWCKKLCLWKKKIDDPDVATVDHLFSKRDGRRRLAANKRICVLAHYNCNQARNRIEEEMLR